MTQHEVGPRIGRSLLSGDVRHGATVIVDMADGDCSVAWQNQAVR